MSAHQGATGVHRGAPGRRGPLASPRTWRGPDAIGAYHWRGYQAIRGPQWWLVELPGVWRARASTFREAQALAVQHKRDTDHAEALTMGSC